MHRADHQRLCTQSCYCGRRIWSGIVFVTLEKHRMTLCVVSAKTMSSLRVGISYLLLRLKRPGNTDGATLSSCGSNSGKALAWVAQWKLTLSRMTSSRRVLYPIMPRRCWWQRFLLIVFTLLLPRRILSHSSLTLLALGRHPWRILF